MGAFNHASHTPQFVRCKYVTQNCIALLLLHTVWWTTIFGNLTGLTNQELNLMPIQFSQGVLTLVQRSHSGLRSEVQLSACRLWRPHQAVEWVNGPDSRGIPFGKWGGQLEHDPAQVEEEPVTSTRRHGWIHHWLHSGHHLCGGGGGGGKNGQGKYSERKSSLASL